VKLRLRGLPGSRFTGGHGVIGWKNSTDKKMGKFTLFLCGKLSQEEKRKSLKEKVNGEWY